MYFWQIKIQKKIFDVFKMKDIEFINLNSRTGVEYVQTFHS